MGVAALALKTENRARSSLKFQQGSIHAHFYDMKVYLQQFPRCHSADNIKDDPGQNGCASDAIGRPRVTEETSGGNSGPLDDW